MQAGTFFGHKCSQCGSTVDIGAVAGAKVLMCCNMPMVPDKNGRSVAAGVHCKKCNTTYGLVNSDQCPSCGTSFT